MTYFIRLLSLLGTTSIATAAPAANAQQGFASMLPMFVAFALVMYFMIIRPQKKRQLEQNNLLNNLQTGDEVSTTGGLMGTVRKVKDNMLVLEIAANTEVVIQKTSVTQVLPRGTLKSMHSKKD